MKKIFKAYIAYINDNPEGYWFKRKMYGWGWTPATKEGWLVTAACLIFVLSVAWRAELVSLTSTGIVTELVLPIAAAIMVLIFLCWKTGESPRWQWKIPAKYFED